MDTNQNTANNYQINTFVKGMNSDTSYDMIGADQYLFGQNIRITNNTLIFGDQHQNKTEGIVTPVYVGEEKVFQFEVQQFGAENFRILAVNSFENGKDDIGVIIVGWDISSGDPSDPKGVWDVLRIEKRDGILQNPELWYVCNSTTQIPETFSTVIHKETEGILNLYIADGSNPIIQIDLINRDDEDFPVIFDADIDSLMSNRLLPTDRINITKVSGRLKTQQLQYTYRLYRKHGATTKLSPLSTKLQVIDSNRNKELGNAENTRTSVGLQLDLEITEDWKNNFDCIQIYRVSYILPNALPEVYLIYDDKIENNTVQFVDKGDEELQRLSIDEFNAMSGEIIIPKSIEQNQGYLFAGNVKDKTVIDFTSSDESVIANNTAQIVYNDVPIVGYYDAADQSVFRDQADPADNNLSNAITIKKYFENLGITITSSNVSYDDMFGSSLLRSLRRGEKYRYGVVYYDKYGARSEVYKIADVDVPDSNIIWTDDNDVVNAVCAGVKCKINRPSSDVVGFQIVRCAKTDEYTTNILQVALSRPSRQGRYEQESYRTPYYPNVYLSTQFLYVTYMDTWPPSAISQTGITWDDLWWIYWDKAGTNVENMRLYQAFSPEINIARKDTVSKLKTSDIKLHPVIFMYESYNNLIDIAKRFQGLSQQNVSHLAAIKALPSGFTNNLEIQSHNPLIGTTDYEFHPVTSGVFITVKALQQDEKANKSEVSAVINLFSTRSFQANTNDLVVIKNVEDVKNPGWGDGFSQVQVLQSPKSALKQYKSYRTNIGSESYVNWVANGMYDLVTTENELSVFDHQSEDVKVFYASNETEEYNDNQYQRGWIGPGPVSLLLNTETPNNNSVLKKQIYENNDGSGKMLFGTIVANITHTALSYNDTYTPYYGFGNFFKFEENTTYKECYVMDGDVYITPAEFVNMFKTYDFNDYVTTLVSGQVVYYIPMESRINTFFDYGMNYRNTSSTNLMLEPGEITGITSQARPLHQYNMIYSDNNSSIEVFMPHIDDDTENQYPHRIHYSQLKTDGENIDNWQIFKPLDFIDVDSQYGQITNMLTSDNTLYYWQDKAFGKLSVNERSLVKDENSNAIQLGTGGVLNRYDYLSTRYGMRPNDRAAITAEHGIYWIDINNKAIPAFTGNGVVNYSELCNVQNLVNQKMADDIPTIYYDLQNYEVLCGINEEEQIVFNIKLNCATALYTRDYDRCLDIDNSLYGFRFSDELYYRKINYLTTEDDKELLSPVKLAFAVNPQASLTKVYDTQKIVLMDAPGQQEGADISVLNNFGVPSELVPRWMVDKVMKDSKIYNPFLADKEFSFSTDYCSSVEDPQGYTDRENNIWYAIPRITNSEYGDRIRGKWLKTEIVDNNPKEFAISHIITKFRQSYS